MSPFSSRPPAPDPYPVHPAPTSRIVRERSRHPRGIACRSTGGSSGQPPSRRRPRRRRPPPSPAGSASLGGVGFPAPSLPAPDRPARSSRPLLRRLCGGRCCLERRRQPGAAIGDFARSAVSLATLASVSRYAASATPSRAAASRAAGVLLAGAANSAGASLPPPRGPSFITMIRSAIARTTFRSWLMNRYARSCRA